MTETSIARPPRYVPLLKGRQGEFTALQNTDAATRSGMTPLIEVSTTALQTNEEGDVERASLDQVMDGFVEKLPRVWDAGWPIIVDAGALPEIQGGVVPTVSLVERFGRDGYKVIPTVRPSDRDDVGRVSDALSRVGFSSACIRLAGEDLDDTDAPLSEAIERVLGLLGFDPRDVDLVLDLGSVADDRAAGFASRIARLVLADVPHLSEWRTVVVAGGAFPPDLTAVPPGVLTEVPRLEAAMWGSVRDRFRQRPVDFGDYGVAHPVLASGVPFAPAPQLRYTTSDSWAVMKGRRSDRRAARQFFDICARVVEEPQFTPDLSWGDVMIARAALAAVGETADIGPGNAMTWRAYGTSHHLAYVVNRLANRGAP